MPDDSRPSLINDQIDLAIRVGIPKDVEIRPATFYLCHSPWLVRQMVIEGLGVGSVVSNTVEKEMDSGQLVSIFVKPTQGLEGREGYGLFSRWQFETPAKFPE